MAVENLYSPIGTALERPSPVIFFMMDKLLYSRMESGYPSNDEFFDEDVNVYIAGLLESLARPDGHEKLRSLALTDDQSLFEKAGSLDPRAAFALYKASADFLLVSIGIFDNPKGRRPNSAPLFTLPSKAYASRGSVYYGLAQSCAVKSGRGRSGLSDVLGKLSKGFEKYARVLSVMKCEYFNIFRRISEGELYHLGKTPADSAIREVPVDLYDGFLDAYSTYMQQRDPGSRRSLERAAAEIGRRDPSFRFELPSDAPDEI